jgi:SAM-dependent methyltransferase
MARPRSRILLGVVVAAAVGALRVRRVLGGREVPGGIVIADVGAYDLESRLLLGSLFRAIAADISAVAPPGSRVLEVGCGPGYLSIRLALVHGLEVIGLDLDPGMIERAQTNAGRAGESGQRAPAFVVGDAASLPFPERSFDLVVSTLSMHHWAEPTRGLAEIGRVLRPGGRAIVWDMRPGLLLLFHHRMRDPVSHVPGSGLRVVSDTPWRWPWRLALLRRIELAPEHPALTTAT